MLSQARRVKVEKAATEEAAKAAGKRPVGSLRVVGVDLMHAVTCRAKKICVLMPNSQAASLGRGHPKPLNVPPHHTHTKCVTA